MYINLLQTQEPLTLHFKPKAGAFADGVLRVAPDMLPEGSLRLEAVWVDDEPTPPSTLTPSPVTLPPDKEVRVKVRIVATSSKFEVSYEFANGRALLTLKGDLDADVLVAFRREPVRVVADKSTRTVLLAKNLTSISSEAMNGLLFYRSKLEMDETVFIVGANEQVSEMFPSDDSLVASGGECLTHVSELPPHP